MTDEKNEAMETTPAANAAAETQTAQENAAAQAQNTQQPEATEVAVPEAKAENIACGEQNGEYHYSREQIQNGKEQTSSAPGGYAAINDPPVYQAFKNASASQAGDQSKQPPKKKKGRGLRNAGIVALCALVCLGAGIGGGVIGTSIHRGDTTVTRPEENTDKNEPSNTPANGTADDDRNVSLPSDSALSDADPMQKKILTIKEIYQKNANAVVEIVTQYTTSGGYWGSVTGESAGSGVILTKDGYLVTNHHVIENAEKIHVRLKSGDTYEATLVGSDKDNDIAVLKLDAEDLSFATLGDSSTVEVGDLCVAIGNPLGVLGGTLTDGIIGALDREITFSDGETRRLLQHNAAVSPGSSGGGLFNENGDLIGIVNAKANSTEAEGIGFAIPINSVKTIINDLISNGYVHGKVELGITVTAIKDGRTAMYYNVDEYGLYITEVNDNSNAKRAGLKIGDRIVSVNGDEVDEISDISAVLQESSVGDVLHFVVHRDGQNVNIDVTLNETVPQGKAQ